MGPPKSRFPRLPCKGAQQPARRRPPRPPLRSLRPPSRRPSTIPDRPRPAAAPSRRTRTASSRARPSKSDYVGFVPKSYAGKPTTLVVGIHGCGDSAYNFATWGVNPYDTRQKQNHIGISIGGKDGQCWDTSTTKDIDKVVAAITDISTCVYVHKQKVVLAGYSSGGILAYKLGLTQAANYAGILIENSGLEGTQPAAAAWKINVAHIAHKQDGDFPLKNTEADWAKLQAAGIPLQTSEVDGTHDGTSDDWNNFLLPKITTWKAPLKPSARPRAVASVPRFAAVRPWLRGWASAYTRAAMKRMLAGLVVSASLMLGLGACSRNNIEAVNLANEGDKAKATDIDTAISKYEQATNLDPTNHRILWKLALAYTKKEAWDKVATTCAKAEKLQPKNALYYFQHGLAMARQAVKGPTSWADAKPPLEQAIQLDTNVGDGDHYGAAHFELAEVLLHMDDEKGALDEYTKAITSKPDTLPFDGPLAELYLRLNHVAEAEQVLTTGLSFAKEGDKALFAIAQPPRRHLRPEERHRKGRQRVRAREEGLRPLQRGRPADRLLQPRRCLREPQAAEEERGHGAAPVLPEDDLQGRRRSAIRRPVHAGTTARVEAWRHASVSERVCTAASPHACPHRSSPSVTQKGCTCSFKTTCIVCALHAPNGSRALIA